MLFRLRSIIWRLIQKRCNPIFVYIFKGLISPLFIPNKVDTSQKVDIDPLIC